MRRNDGYYYVTRQAYYYSGTNTVEVSRGRDGAGPDALMPKWELETEQFEDPREAVKAAVKILVWWRRDERDRCVDEGREYCITHSNTGIHGYEGEPCTIKEMYEWAKAAYKSLPKCEYCGSIIHERYSVFGDVDEAGYCSQFCAESAWEEAEAIDQAAIDDWAAENEKLLQEAV